MVDKELASFMQKETKNLVREVETKLFVDLYAICVPEKERVKTQKTVRALRKKQWTEALKKAKGNEEAAIDALLKAY